VRLGAADNREISRIGSISIGSFSGRRKRAVDVVMGREIDLFRLAVVAMARQFEPGLSRP